MSSKQGRKRTEGTVIRVLSLQLWSACMQYPFLPLWYANLVRVSLCSLDLPFSFTRLRCVCPVEMVICLSQNYLTVLPQAIPWTALTLWIPLHYYSSFIPIRILNSYLQHIKFKTPFLSFYLQSDYLSCISLHSPYIALQPTDLCFVISVQNIPAFYVRNEPNIKYRPQ